MNDAVVISYGVGHTLHLLTNTTASGTVDAADSLLWDSLSKVYEITSALTSLFRLLVCLGIILAVATNRKLHRKPMAFVCLVAGFHVIVGVSEILFLIRYAVHDPDVKKNVLRVYLALVLTGESGIILGQITLTLDKFLFILYPLHYGVTKMSRKHVYVMVFSVVVCSLGLCAWHLTHGFSPRLNNWDALLPIQYSKNILIVIATVVVVGLYGKIFQTAYKQQSIIRKSTMIAASRSQSNFSFRNELKIVKGYFIMTASTFLCWMPMGVVNIYYLTVFSSLSDDQRRRINISFQITHILLSFSLFLDPLIMAWANPGLRRILLVKVSCGKITDRTDYQYNTTELKTLITSRGSQASDFPMANTIQIS